MKSKFIFGQQLLQIVSDVLENIFYFQHNNVNLTFKSATNSFVEALCIVREHLTEKKRFLLGIARNFWPSSTM